MGSFAPATKVSGQEVLNGYAAITTNFTYSTDNNFTDVTGLSITFTPVQARVKIRVFAPALIVNTTAQRPGLGIFDAADAMVNYGECQCVTGSLIQQVGVETLLNLTPGTEVTYKARVKRGLAGASTVTVEASSGVAFIEAVYV